MEELGWGFGAQVELGRIPSGEAVSETSEGGELMDLKDLAKPFAPDRISWRVGPTNAEKTKGVALGYIDARDVQDRLNEVCGVENWQCRYTHAEQKTICEIGILIHRSTTHSEWVFKANGAGDTDMEAEKGAISDAFKRAAVMWGIGRYLYDLDSPWVQLEARGRSYVIAPSEYPKLRALLSKDAQRAPEGHAVEQPKQAPGISKAKAWLSGHLHDLNGVSDADDFMAILGDNKGHWVKIKREYPGLWMGPDGSGLRGESMKVATIHGCRSNFDEFVKHVEQLAADTKGEQK